MENSRLLQPICLLVVVAGVLFVYVVVNIYQTGFADFPIFIKATQHFVATGELYPKDLSLYGPAAAIYKYPPTLSLLILCLLKLGFGKKIILLFFFAVQLIVYVGSLWLAIKLLKPEKSHALFITLLLLVSLLHAPFFETLHGLQLETFILFFVLLALQSFQQQKMLATGLILAVPVMLKIYPLFLLPWFIYRGGKNILFGFLIGSGVVVALSMVAFGIEENTWFYSVLLPEMLSEKALLINENMNLARYFREIPWVNAATALLCSKLVFVGFLAYFVFTMAKNNYLKIGSDIEIELSLMVVLLMLAITNSWSNYQLLLLLPLWVAIKSCTNGSANKVIITLLCATVLLLFFSENYRIHNLLWLPESLHNGLVNLRGIVPVMLIVCLLLIKVQINQGAKKLT